MKSIKIVGHPLALQTNILPRVLAAVSIIAVLATGSHAWAQAPEGKWEVAEPVGFQIGGKPVPLSDGKVLVVDQQGSKAKVFNPASGKWKAVSPKQPLPTDVGAVAALADGRLMSVNGESKVSLWDPDTNKTTRGATAPGLLKVAFNLTALPDGPKALCGANCGKVLLTGSCYGAKGIGALYDPVKDSWTPPMPLVEKERCHHTSTVLRNGKVLIAGGDNGDSSTLYVSAEIFDPLANTFSPTGSLRSERNFPEAVLLPDGKVLVVGAAREGECGFCPTPAAPSRPKSAEIYDPDAGTWTDTGDTKESLAAFSYSSAMLGNGKALLVVVGTPLDKSTELYDPGAGAWSYAAPLAAKAVSPSLVLLNKKPCGSNCGKALLIAQDGSTQVYTPTGPLKAQEADASAGGAQAKETKGQEKVSSSSFLLPGIAVVVLLSLGALFLVRRRSRSE